MDFFQKSFERVHEPQRPESSQGASDAAEPVNDHQDSIPNTKPMGLRQAGTTFDRDEHKRFVRQRGEYELLSDRQASGDLVLFLTQAYTFKCLMKCQFKQINPLSSFNTHW